MKEYSLINKKGVRKNKELKGIQKRYCKEHKGIRRKYPKATIGKVVQLREFDNFYDLTATAGENTAKSAAADCKTLDLTKEEFLALIKKQGVYGLSGSGFPTDKKIQTVIESGVKDKYLIVNGAECDPGLLHDGWLLENRLSEIESGIQILDKYIGFSEIIVATKEDINSKGNEYKFHKVPNRYPVGAEKILIQETLGIHMEQNEIPAGKGILVLNVQTVFSVYEAVCRGCQVDTRFLTVADITTGEAVIARVSLHTNVNDALIRIMGDRKEKTVFFGGGIMMAGKAGPDDVIDVKTNFIGYGNDVDYQQNEKCKKCGACVRNCPMDIQVSKIIQALEKGEITKAREFQPEKCIKCGTCTYFCRAGKNTMELVSALN